MHEWHWSMLSWHVEQRRASKHSSRKMEIWARVEVVGDGADVAAGGLGVIGFAVVTHICEVG